MAIAFLLLLLLSFFSLETFGCSIIAECLDITGYSKTEVNSPENLEKVISTALENNMNSPQVDSRTSLFELFVPIYASLSGISEAAQKKLYIEALFDHMNKACLKTILKMKNSRITSEEETEIVQKIWLTCNETSFFDEFKYKIAVPNRTVTLMLQVLNLIDPEALKTRGMILKLAQFCESETCQEIVYSSILNTMNNQNKKLPLLKIKYELGNTVKYDAFLKTSYEIYTSERSHLIPLENLIRTIISGPNSIEASRILLGIMNSEMLIKISKNLESVVHLTRMLLNTNSFDLFAGIFLTGEQEIISGMKRDMLKIKERYDAIQAILRNSTTTNNSDASFIEYIELFRNYLEAFKEYYAVDPVFIRNAIRQLNSEIFALINYFNNRTELTKKLVSISVAFIILNVIPVLHLTDFVLTDYEPLLDAYLSPELAALPPNINADQISKIIIHPFARLETSTLEKLFTAFQRISRNEAENQLHLAVTLALYWRDFDDQIFLKALDVVVNFYESKQLDMSIVFASILPKFLNKREYFLAHIIFKMGREKKILPKSMDLVVEKYLEKYGNFIDLKELFDI